MKLKFKKSLFAVTTLSKLMQYIQSLEDDKEYELSVDTVKKKRSLNANAYMWEICGKIAEEMSKESPVSKDDVYRNAIRSVGIYKDFHNQLPGDAKTLIAAWQKIGTGWLAEQLDFEQDGEHVVIRAYYGSSQYNSRQMSRLIDFIVQDAKALGIETMTPEQLALIKDEWGKHYE